MKSVTDWIRLIILTYFLVVNVLSIIPVIAILRGNGYLGGSFAESVKEDVQYTRKVEVYTKVDQTLNSLRSNFTTTVLTYIFTNATFEILYKYLLMRKNSDIGVKAEII
jgi:acyl carrier protein phosphodiesterase